MEWFFTGKEKVHQFANVGKTSGGHTVRFTNEIAAITRLHEACSKPDKHIQYSFPIVFPNKWQRTTSYGWLTVWLCITATSCGCKLCLFIAHVRKQACFCQIKMDIFLSSYRRAKLKNNFENISKWLELEWILSVSVTCLPHSFGIIGFSFTVIFFFSLFSPFLVLKVILFVVRRHSREYNMFAFSSYFSEALFRPHSTMRPNRTHLYVVLLNRFVHPPTIKRTCKCSMLLCLM